MKRGIFKQNFEKTILLSIVERSNNYGFRGNMTPKTHGERPVGHEIYPLFVYCICYWEAYRLLREDFALGVGFHGEENFQW